MRTCTKCGEAKALTEFYSAGGGTVRGDCKDCNKSWRREWYATNKVARPAVIKRQNHKGGLKIYNLNPDEYEAMWVRQAGVCLLCGQPERSIARGGGIKRLAVDHDHRCCPERARSCGRCVRGLLCQKCNLMLGYARDSVTLLQAAVEYLEAA